MKKVLITLLKLTACGFLEALWPGAMVLLLLLFSSLGIEILSLEAQCAFFSSPEGGRALI